MRDAGEADVYNLRFFVPEEFVRLCYAAADATLANSGHEPFGLVGLEVMAAGGIAFTGSTGEDYAVSFENAVALDSDDPDEIVGYLLHMRQPPEARENRRRWQAHRRRIHLGGSHRQPRRQAWLSGPQAEHRTRIDLTSPLAPSPA